MTPELDRREFVGATAAAGLSAGLASGSASASTSGKLTAGVARRDITPESGDSMFGYVRPDILADGVSLRLFARALVIGDGERKIALVSADLGKPGVRDEVIDHASALGFDRDTVLFSATHTHAGPNDIDEWIAGQIGDAIEEADANRQPARAGWGTGTVTEGNWNRSLAAHLSNFGIDIPIGEADPEDHPIDPDRARDTTARVLRVEGTDGTPIAAWTLFGNHPTAFTPGNTTYSADFPAAAARWFERRFDDGDAPLMVHANGRVGDQIPEYDDYGQYPVAERTGLRIERAIWDGWQTAGDALTRALPVDGRASIVEYDGQEVEPGKRVSSTGVYGAPLLDGGENGPTPFSGLELEGSRRPEWLADDVHGRKIIISPAIYSSEVEVQALRVGDELLVTVPGEPTVEMGRRMRQAAAEAAPSEITRVSVVGVTNGYNGYFTTPEEYERQDYEGGHTVFGKYTSLLVRNVQQQLAAEVTATGDQPDPSGSRPSVPEPPVDDGASSGSLTDQPAATVERMETVTVEWRGGWFGKDRPVGEPFLVLEREENGWKTVTTDLRLGFEWHEQAGSYEARYDVPPHLPTGTYRLRVQAANYELTTDAFEIVPSTGLTLRGVRSGDGDDVVLVAQNPPPDPDENLRVRPLQPEGGSATVRIDGTEYEADWDPGAAGWVVSVPGVSEGDAVTVPPGGLVDEYGNRNGADATLTVGEVAALQWPENVETGGGDPPGLFGIGTIPT